MENGRQIRRESAQTAQAVTTVLPASFYLNLARNGGGARRGQSLKTSYTALGDDFVTSAPRSRRSAPEPTTAQSTTITCTSSLRRTNVQLGPTVRSVANRLSTVRLAQMAVSLVIASTLITRVRHAGMASTQILVLGIASSARPDTRVQEAQAGKIRRTRFFMEGTRARRGTTVPRAPARSYHALKVPIATKRLVHR
jgi:hypothetical protein